MATNYPTIARLHEPRSRWSFLRLDDEGTIFDYRDRLAAVLRETEPLIATHPRRERRHWANVLAGRQIDSMLARHGLEAHMNGCHDVLVTRIEDPVAALEGFTGFVREFSDALRGVYGFSYTLDPAYSDLRRQSLRACE